MNAPVIRNGLCSAALAALLLAPVPAGAVFIQAVDRDPDIESSITRDYFIDLLTYRVSHEWEEKWREAKYGLLLNMGSINCCELYSVQQAKVDHRLRDGLSFIYRLDRNEDKELEEFHQWLELRQRVAGGFHVSMFGEPTFWKKDSDVGFSASYFFDDIGYIRAYYILVDYFYNDKNYGEDRYARDPRTVGADFDLAFSKVLSMSGGAEFDLPMEWNRPDERYVFVNQKASARFKIFHVFKGGSVIGSRARLRVERDARFYTASWDTRSMDYHIGAGEPDIFYIFEIPPLQKFTAGFNWVIRRASARYPDMPDFDNDYSRDEYQPYLKYRHSFDETWSVDAGYFYGHAPKKRIYLNAGGMDERVTTDEHKLKTAVEIIFSKESRLDLNITWALYKLPKYAWGGGNVQFMLGF